MNTFQITVKYIAIGFAILLTVGIISGILSMFGLFSEFFSGDTVTEDIKTYTVSSDINELNVKINAADFQIKQGDIFLVESNLKHLTVDDKNGILTIKETKKINSTYSGAVLTLYIPKDTLFEKANLTTGAGRLTVDKLSANIVNLELGAGEVTINTLVAASGIDIDGGAGKITLSEGALHNLDLDMGVGQLNLTTALTGECELDLGVGESNITVIGNMEDYKLGIEKGIGNITVNGRDVSNLKNQGNGNNSIDISGGVGAINLEFKESDIK